LLFFLSLLLVRLIAQQDGSTHLCHAGRQQQQQPPLYSTSLSLSALERQAGRRGSRRAASHGTLRERPLDLVHSLTPPGGLLCCCCRRRLLLLLLLLLFLLLDDVALINTCQKELRTSRSDPCTFWLGP
jgi:hypothetical protein